MKRKLLDVLVCPVCLKTLSFEGSALGERLANGVLRCTANHVFQVKSQIPILKDPKASGKEFVWSVDFPDLEKYDGVRREYASYLPEELKEADEELKEAIGKSAAGLGLVLDVASGMGTLLLKLSCNAGQETDLVGTDVDEKPLRGARFKLEAQGTCSQVSLCVMDGKHLAFGSGKVRCVTSFFGFDNIPEANVALSEAYRVLVPGGRLVLASLGFEEGSRSMVEAEKLNFGAISTRDRLSRILEAAGFKIDKCEVYYSGKWARNPMDLLPFEGDWFSHSLVVAHK